MRRVGDDDAVEAELLAQEIRVDLLGDGRGEDVLVGHVRVEVLLVARERDVAGHQRRETRVEQRLVQLAERLVPFLRGEPVGGMREVLVSLVDAVAGPVLGCRGDALLLDALHVGEAHLDRLIDVGTPGATRDDRVAPVAVDVDDRGERPVAADRVGFDAGDATEFVGVLRVVCAGDLRFPADVRAVGAGAVAAGLGIGGDEHRDLRLGLEDVVLLPDFLRRAGVIADGTDVVVVQDAAQVFFCALRTHVDEQLTDLLFVGHARDGVLDPLDTLVVKIERGCLQVDHVHSFMRRPAVLR